MIRAALFDAKPYDRENFQAEHQTPAIQWTFHDFRLDARTAALAAGCESVCAFVNDRIDRACLEALAAAGIFRGFGATVLASDLYPDEAWAASGGVTYAPMERLLAESDILSLHTPLTPATHHLLSHAAFLRMKPGAMLVNTSRGKLVDTHALLEALKSGHLGGVALDVYEEEEGVFFEDLSGQILGDDELARLLTFPNVLVTAHQAFLTREALAEISRVTLANIRAAAAGLGPLPGTEV